MIEQLDNLLQKNSFNRRRSATYLLASALAITSLPGVSWSQEHSDTDKAVAEFEWQLPATPVSDNLQPFYVSLTTRQSFAIDTKSLSVDSDGVVRYTVIGTSTGGAKNISYEGIRCSSAEKRIYAIGHTDGSWTRARDSEWQPIAFKGANLQHAELAQNYFCESGRIAGKLDQILQKIRYHRDEPGQR